MCIRDSIASAQQTLEVAIHGINRVLFPLTALVIVWLAKMSLAHWQHTSLLQLASHLLLAMAAIRLAVYILRYVFSPSGWMKKTENIIAATIWTILALHLSGLLPELLGALDEISFTLGKSKVTLLLVIQAVLTVVITVIIALWLSRIIENRLMQSANPVSYTHLANTAHVRTSELALIPNEVIDLLALKAANIVSGTVKNAKIFLSGDITAKYNIQGLLLTKGARAAVEAAGGKVLEAA